MRRKHLYLSLLSCGFIAAGLFGCSSTEQESVADNRVVLMSQADLDLMIENARAEERNRIQQELDAQQQQKSLFNEIRLRQLEKQQLLDKRAVIRIEPNSTAAVFYKNIDGNEYYRCGANAMTPIADSAGNWYYHKDTEVLSATLCETSRDKKTLKALQQKLFDMGYLYSNGLSEDKLIDGVWRKSSLEALQRYQEYHGLLYAQLTIESLEHLGIFPATNDSYALLGVNSIAPLTELELALQERLKQEQGLNGGETKRAQQDLEEKVVNLPSRDCTNSP